MLYFETLTGLKGYGKLNEYHGLENEIVKYISILTITEIDGATRTNNACFIDFKIDHSRKIHPLVCDIANKTARNFDPIDITYCYSGFRTIGNG